MNNSETPGSKFLGIINLNFDRDSQIDTRGVNNTRYCID